MKIVSPSRRKNALISYKRERNFRDTLITISRRHCNMLFLHSQFNNPFYTYEALSMPLPNGTYKVKVISVDDLDNINTGIEGTIVLDYFPLPPKNITARISETSPPPTLNWLLSASANQVSFTSICWSPDLGLLVAVAYSYTDPAINISSDGVNWTPISVMDSFLSVCWSPELGIFVATTSNGTYPVYTSIDGINWIGISAPVGTWFSVCWSPTVNKFVATGLDFSGNRLMYSSDGVNWNLVSPFACSLMQSVCWSPELGLFCATVTGGLYSFATSIDGINWIGRTSVDIDSCYSICWSSELGLFCAVRTSGINSVALSSDGINWDAYDIGIYNDLRSVAWSGTLGYFVAVGHSGNIIISSNGISWTQRPISESNDFNSVCWSETLGKFFGVAATGTNRILYDELEASSLYRIILEWQHSVDGAPDTYIVYGNEGSGNINKSIVKDSVNGSLLTTFVDVVAGAWKFTIDSRKNGVNSDNLELVTIYVPTNTTVPEKPGIDGKGLYRKTYLVLERVSVGKVKISFLWLFGDTASTFNIYHDDGTGTINYSTPKFAMSRIDSIYQEYLTTQLHAENINKTYKFVVRAVSANGVEEQNTDIYMIDVDGVEPDNAEDLTLESVF